MAKGNICYICKKVAINFSNIGNKVYCLDCLKCRDCQKKFKNGDEVITSSGNNGHYLQCKECSEKQVACAKCKKKPWKHSQDDGKGGKIQVCEDCHSQRNDGDESLCEKCQKNPQSGKLGADKWNFCQECLKEKRGYILCPICNKIKFWGFSHSIPGEGISTHYDKGEKWEWKDEVAYQRRKEGRNGCCSDACEKEQENRRPFCIKCKKNKICRQHPELCFQCLENPKDNPNIPNKKEPNEDKDHKPNPSECCERCGTSCIVSQTKTSYTWKKIRITMYYTDFRKEVHYFGTKCPCAEEFKKEHQQTCPQCQKHEFPDMKKGWMLDYEIKKAFCSPDCHVKHRNLSWEQAGRLTQIEMMPPELDVEINPQRQNTDWEREGLRREVLYWRESVRELQRQLEESKRKPSQQRHPNEVPHQERQISYLLNLHQNTQRRVEQAYQSRYGALNEDGSDKGKGLSGGVIALIVIGVVALVGGIVFLLTRNKKKIK